MAKVVHFEIPFDNKPRAMKFYAESFDWRLTDMPEMSTEGNILGLFQSTE